MPKTQRMFEGQGARYQPYRVEVDSKATGLTREG